MDRISNPSVINHIQAERCSSGQASNRHDEHLSSYPWLQHYEEGVPVQLEFPNRPLTWLLDKAANRHPNQTAFIYYGSRITYAQFSNLANRFAIVLQRLGVRKGDRVAIALPNIPQFPIAFYGALRAGAVVVPTNPLYTEREMQYQLADSGAKIIVMLDTFYSSVRKIRQQTALEHVIVTNPADWLSPSLRLLYPLQQRWSKSAQPGLTNNDFAQDPTLHRMQPMLVPRTKGGIELFKLPVPTRSEDLAVLQYTGGTTGRSKGAMLTHRNLLTNAIQTWNWFSGAQEAAETTLCVIPFFHSYGLTGAMNLSILAAATMILVPRFKAKDTLELIDRYHPTLFPGIPTLYIAIIRELSRHSYSLQSIKCCMSGSAPLPAKVQEEFEALTHGKLVEGYGLSEASPVTHCNPLNGQCRSGSIGLPLPDVEAAIMNSQTGDLLPVGEIGEIVVKGPNIMQGYCNRPEETQAIFTNGWLRTGDIGRMDADGYFYVIDRAKDMIIASGFNVYPREVEEVLFEHPAVEEAAVVGIIDSYRGETVAAFVVLRPGIEASEQTKQELLAFCKEKL
ncbi:MAG TPA: long-chain fatty acid--CoA ligase, partial [Ktedonobacteraceae bacterium]|nr:long-chain fatty acid--CoA ligase [Ktedonobacteraceae bacterium]